MSVFVQDLMAHVAVNSLGTITNLEKEAIKIPVHEPSNWPCQTASGDLGVFLQLMFAI